MVKKIAIFPAGSEIGLEINNSLRFLKEFEVIGLSSVSDHSLFVYDKIITNLPFYSDEFFIEKLNDVIKNESIDFIYPANDNVHLFLIKNQSLINVKIISSNYETVDICRHKKKTYELFKEYGFVPKTFTLVEAISTYPIFIKPNVGQGSQGARKISSREELMFHIHDGIDYIISEYMPGEEYTIDCFTDLKGELEVCVQRIRNRIKMGISVNSFSLKLDKKVYEIAKIINSKLKINGAWFFQLKKDINNNYKLLEVGPRISGTMGLSRNMGINFEALTIYNYMDVKTKIIKNDITIEVDRSLFSKYKSNYDYNKVYVDFDDTIILNKKVNSLLMFYLYQMHNLGKKIFLITRHIGNIDRSLRKYSISKNLFSMIYHLQDGEKKSDYIVAEKSIFIDDSFSERLDVSKLNIPVFGLDNVEALIDWSKI